MIDLGTRVKEKSSGLAGVVTAVARYQEGTTNALVEFETDGARERRWIDMNGLEDAEAKEVPVVEPEPAPEA